MDSPDCTNPKLERPAADGLSVGDAMVANPKTMPADGTVADLRAMFANPHVRTALLVDGLEFAGVVHRDAVTADAADETPARELADRDVPTTSPATPLADAWRLLDERGESRLVVIDPDGRTLSGLLCMTGDRTGFCQS
ncbi:MAG: CBS domain-containing protein [Actinobacteria bacterium]|nr:CBS domain-containing protein [Actinomycetota bacterium]